MTKEECLELELSIMKDVASYFLKKHGMEEYIINSMFDDIHETAWLQYNNKEEK